MRQIKFVVICIGILAVSMLAACGARVDAQAEQRYSQEILNRAEPACLHHIEYLVVRYDRSVAITPNINPATDKPFHC